MMRIQPYIATPEEQQAEIKQSRVIGNQQKQPHLSNNTPILMKFAGYTVVTWKGLKRNPLNPNYYEDDRENNFVRALLNIVEKNNYPDIILLQEVHFVDKLKDISNIPKTLANYEYVSDDQGRVILYNRKHLALPKQPHWKKPKNEFSHYVGSVQKLLLTHSRGYTLTINNIDIPRDSDPIQTRQYIDSLVQQDNPDEKARCDVLIAGNFGSDTLFSSIPNKIYLPTSVIIPNETKESKLTQKASFADGGFLHSQHELYPPTQIQSINPYKGVAYEPIKMNQNAFSPEQWAELNRQRLVITIANHEDLFTDQTKSIFKNNNILIRTSSHNNNEKMIAIRYTQQCEEGLFDFFEKLPENPALEEKLSYSRKETLRDENNIIGGIFYIPSKQCHHFAKKIDAYYEERITAWKIIYNGLVAGNTSIKAKIFKPTFGTDLLDKKLPPHETIQEIEKHNQTKPHDENKAGTGNHSAEAWWLAHVHRENCRLGNKKLVIQTYTSGCKRSGRRANGLTFFETADENALIQCAANPKPKLRRENVCRQFGDDKLKEENELVSRKRISTPPTPPTPTPAKNKK